MKPSDKADVSPEKAKKILKDDSAHGHPLTPAQKGMFGAIAGKEDKPVKNSAVGTTEGDTQDEGMSCPHCGGPAEPLGDLGNLTHYRCRNCGGQFATHNESFSGFKRPEKQDKPLEKEDKKPERGGPIKNSGVSPPAFSPAAASVTPKVTPKAEVVKVGTPEKKKEAPVKNSALGSTAGSAIGGALGSAAGPIGSVVGSAIGGAVGDQV